MGKTNIEWTDRVWNPVTGCTKISQGCKNCYAERVAGRFWGERQFSEVRNHPERLNFPLGWKKPQRVFVDSMSDLFHPDVPFKFIDQVFATMMLASRHTFIILTKRPQRMADYFGRWTNGGFSTPEIVRNEAIKKNSSHIGYTWPLRNVWLGVSAENQNEAEKRIPLLLDTPAIVRFVSCEPLLGPVNLTALKDEENIATYNALTGEFSGNSDGSGPSLDWVISGGESGPYARPMHPDWVRSLRDQCQIAAVPFFFKQWGEWKIIKDAGIDPAPNDRLWERVGKKSAGRLLDGREWNDYPKGQ